MIGTTRSRVSFFTNKFRKLGFIGYNGEIEVHHSLLNAVLHDSQQTQGGLERDDFSSNRHPALSFCLSMIFSENRYPLFRIML